MIEAIILAGGLGTRLRGVVGDLPKPMARVAGRPFLFWLLASLEEQGFQRAILSLGYRAEVIQDYFGDRFAGMELRYSVEAEPLGTGGALKLATSQVEGERVVALNGDTYTDLDLSKLVYEFDCAQVQLALGVAPSEQSSRYGGVRVDQVSHRITAFAAKSKNAEAYLNAGVYCFRPTIFERYPTENRFSWELDFIRQHLPALTPLAVFGIERFLDIGVPEDYERAPEVISSLQASSKGKLWN
jgi:D-glycero-alpha-D-manno-heptose 1-phosphate guanylyltransferase